MSEHTQPVPDFTLVPDDKGYHRMEEMPDLGVRVYTSRLPYVDVEGHGRMPFMPPSVSVYTLGDANDEPLYWQEIRGDDSDAALDARRQDVIDRLRAGTIRHDGTHLHIEDVAVEVYRYMEERLAYYEQHDDIADDSVDDPESWAYNTLAATLRADAYDLYDLWDEDEGEADDDRPGRVSDRLAAAGINWELFGAPPTTDWIVRGLAGDIVRRWEEHRTAATEGRLPSSMAPHEHERLGLQLLIEEMEARGSATTVDDVLPMVAAKLNDLTARRWVRPPTRSHDEPDEG